MADTITHRKIIILPDFIANQIAAGEVVQRPESVIKELVENSLDAGADSIAVVVRGAGKNLIHVVDNGSGMSKEDLALSCRRHATSKILSVEDLEEIKSFGFRGEALASISSVANIEIRTKKNDDEHGWRLLSDPGKEELIEACSTETGAQVLVRNLFFNVPARRKFLRSNLTEFRYISDTMIKFALSKPKIRFTFYDDDTLIFDAKPAPIIQRVGEVLGMNTAESLIQLDNDDYDIKVSGFIGQPHLAKQSRAGQYLFLNGRSIISKSLSHAVFSAYEHLLEKSTNPFFLLNIELDPKQYDVNVHPQKHEVKFENERAVYGLINKAVNKVLIENNLAPGIQFAEQMSRSPYEKMEFSSVQGRNDVLLVNKMTGEILEPKLNEETRLNNRNFQGNNQQNRFSNYNYDAYRFSPKPNSNELSAFDALFGGKIEEGQQAGLINQGREPFKQAYYYWQLHNKYIFIQTENGLMIIDQHAAHERILYEKAIKAMNKEFAYSQDLLFPVNVQLNSSELTVVKEISTELNSLGYVLTINDACDAEMKAVPLDVTNGNEIGSFKEIIDEFAENQKIRHTEKRDNLAASYSCKAAIKTGQSLKFEEMKKLVSDLFLCEVPYACPHGRPIIIEFSLQEFDKRFGRI